MKSPSIVWSLPWACLLAACSTSDSSSVRPSGASAEALSEGLAAPAPGVAEAAIARPSAAVSIAADPSLRLAAMQAAQAQITDAHRVQTLADGLVAEAAEARVRGRFDEGGVQLSSLDGAAVQGRLTLTSVSRGGARRAIEAAKPVASGAVVRWEHGAGKASVEESWQAGPLGLEHRVLVRQRPAGQGAVELEVAVAGLHAEQDGEQVRLASAGGALGMRDYFVRDAAGKLLAGSMTVRDGKVVYAYEDEGAAYPVEIDPLVYTQQARLVGSDAATNNAAGYSAQLSADGNTALVGSINKAEGYVFVRAGTAWTQQQVLSSLDAGPGSRLGEKVALSGDGNTAIMGATDANNGGAAIVFSRTGTTWTQQQSLVRGDLGNDAFGCSLALSKDGSTALVGALGKSGNIGAAYVFVRTGTTWAQQQKLTASDGVSPDLFGTAVGLSADGSVALVGASNRASGTGAAYAFTRTGTTWAQQQIVTSSDAAASDRFADYLSMSADGNTALISGAGNNSARGAGYVFVRAGATWTQQQKLTSSDAINNDYLGTGTALSADGNRALLGAPSKLSGTGAAYAFTRTGTTWAQQQKILPADVVIGDLFGYGMALSEDGSTALVSAPQKNSSALVIKAGVTYAFSLALSQGDTCTTSAECGTGFCTDGVCCNSACGGTSDCQACSVAAGAAVNGTCGPTTGNTCSDGNSCTQTDTCQVGVCIGANPVVCAAQDQCHNAGTCDPSNGQCSNPNKANGTVCNDGNACTQSDSCQTGVCTGGNPVSCAALDQCHVAGTCDTTTGVCSQPAAPNGTACSDGNSCTQTDSCQVGVCVGANPVVCAAQDQCHTAGSCDTSTGKCSQPAKADGSLCSDGNACTTIDTCQSGVCASGSPVVCTALDQCHVAGTCDTTTGVCSQPAKSDGAACSDGNACTQSDSCQTGVCTGGKALSCDDGNACTSNVCDPTSGCQNPAVVDGTLCDDGNVCNVGDRCVAGACKPTGGLDCDDKNPCTTDSCDGGGKCVHTPLTDGAACSDGDACTTTDTCQAGVCTGGAALDCDDKNQCSKDACDPASGCTHTDEADATSCDDGNGCTVDDTCQAGACKSGAGKTCTPPECQQGTTCDTGTGTCQFTPVADGTPCSAGVCTAGSCVGAGGSGGASGAGGDAGAAGDAGSAGDAGAAGSGGDAGAAGAAGGAGAAGDSGQAGTAGAAGSAGTAGKAGGAGTAGSGGSGQSGTAGQGGAGQGGAGQGGASGSGAMSGSSGQSAGGRAGAGGVVSNDEIADVEGGSCGVASPVGSSGVGASGAMALLAGLAAAVRRRRDVRSLASARQALVSVGATGARQRRRERGVARPGVSPLCRQRCGSSIGGRLATSG